MKVRIANNKNIQNMEQKDIDIYEILKGVEYGTELYTPICGRVWHSGIANDKDSAKAIWTEDEDGREHFFDKNGKVSKEGEVLLFPSKQMRDWSKFFKKGDVLEYKKENNQATCLFDSYEDDKTKLRFTGLYTLTKGKIWDAPTSWDIHDWVKSDHPAEYIKTIEERLGGKLNRETLEIEKPVKLTFEIGKLYVFREEDEDGELTIIGKLIDKNESEDTLTFGNQYEIENEKFVADQTFDLRISVHEELREATEGEYCTFKEAYTLWQKKPRKPMDKPAFKTFDKVLVRDGDYDKWNPAIFIECLSGGRFSAFSITDGNSYSFNHCIPFDGHEHLTGTKLPADHLPY